ncbi:bifunctional 2-C-methyl-D-erythritol 4-phosphate cytidylyltransferase/2-C-methyl-D-erythritol 2,4-cyclodiphosphate synthase [Palleronia sediminis]|uniref:Bifunctional enzyme IspD/IspF n=1 Tax=Palleronia sediminis TaxID=2547833 RepID=A0A4R6AJR3_9RHOB|nr:bifunctional 2-C-methyl-D-erythritol 4-phosphate cytidylyltransferase/2-C-methyl-D-erythritol 2,4-cyclodiphosphate synthase [Palleronia sediminis]TDL83595.1 bifunctional 2-C-methyl-D-erythritol 4-phosphate cytidylyltransferase/2-C-methyl-D-erythritol 2,4-cyclodiphosphate synthase [Palleronia sediminis]
MDKDSTVAAIIVAAGRGRRAGPGRPKQWRELAGRTVAAWTIDAFRSHPRIAQVVLVLAPDDMGLAPGWDAHPDMRVVAGGDTRAQSVAAGLAALDALAPDAVLIHDVARPLVPADMIDRVIDALAHAPGAAPALAVVDALWTGADGRVQGVHPRDGLFRAQTPQGFRFAAIRAAHRSHGGAAADDVEIARAAGLDVSIVEGDERAFKITGPGDFARAEAIVAQSSGGRMRDIRTGTGYDVHAFGPGDAVTLCGVAVPFDRALSGHSDADVGLHALTDAIYGALAEGDIGTHFPPSDPQWKGTASHVFLEHAVSRAGSRGFRIGNVDVTLICERPRIGPHADAMRARTAEILDIAADRVSIKATTSERLGFTGREEGIAAIASVTLIAD